MLQLLNHNILGYISKSKLERNFYDGVKIIRLHNMCENACESLLHCTNSILYTIHMKYYTCVNVNLHGKKKSVHACILYACLFTIIWLLCIVLFSLHWPSALLCLSFCLSVCVCGLSRPPCTLSI